MEKAEPLSFSKSLTYRAEGHNGLVLSHKYNKVVYRLKKTNRLEEKSSQVTVHDEGKDQLQQGVDYIYKVLHPLVGNEYVKPVKIVSLEEGLVDKVNTEFVRKRPGYRLEKVVDPSCHYALQMHDACFIPKSTSSHPTFSVEIKPKVGSMPIRSQTPGMNPLKYSCCRYCMHQYQKLATKKWTEVSKYCPIDLFSGDPRRMKHTLKNLIEIPQNNLRIFKNGKTILSEDTRRDLECILNEDLIDNTPDQDGVDELMSLVVQALRHSKETERGTSRSKQACWMSNYQQAKDHHSVIAEDVSLPKGCVLDRILQIQLLDDLGIEQLHKMYQNLEEKSQLDQSSDLYGLHNPDYDTWTITSIPQPTAIDIDYHSYMVQKVKEYMVSATLKDCSILVAVQRVDPGEKLNNNNVVLERNGKYYRFSVTIIDLDIKPPEKVPDHYKLEQTILSIIESRLDILAMLEKKGLDFSNGKINNKKSHIGANHIQ
ncbi:inositol-pentakisphosphate 2-kinase-like [Lineus longissimus]|uniref:inositol-pentakisphosphate 2-kinase-like n=1 Tax=Lineus longissimus TaxID=88925 RepID=UPI002B4E8441